MSWTTTLKERRANMDARPHLYKDNGESLARILEDALWGIFAGDALAAPTHWFYGGYPQIVQIYGRPGITTYTRPVFELPGSILNKSNLSGGGRSTTTTTFVTKQGGRQLPTIIGNVINHDKADLWSPNKSIHYHATLQAGENTLEVQLARVLMKSIVRNHGTFNADSFRKDYIAFMTTPGSHNDTYASTCHRMFFANWFYKKLPPEQCPDDDGHNVDTIDGLVLPTIAALAAETEEMASQYAVQTATVTRNGTLLPMYAREWGKLVHRIVHHSQHPNNDTRDTNQPWVQQAAETMARNLGLRKPTIRTQDEITACYLDSAVPALLDSILKYSAAGTSTDFPKSSVWDALLANANTGGENVHRGSCLGAVLGAVASTTLSSPPSPSEMREELYDYETIGHEIQEFVQTIMQKRKQQPSSAQQNQVSGS
jgi:ADP-ribosylglycohydrolase